MPDWAINIVFFLVSVPIFGRLYAWWSDPDRTKRTDLGQKLGRLVYGKRWDYPLGKSFEEQNARSDGRVAGSDDV